MVRRGSIIVRTRVVTLTVAGLIVTIALLAVWSLVRLQDQVDREQAQGTAVARQIAASSSTLRDLRSDASARVQRPLETLDLTALMSRATAALDQLRDSQRDGHPELSTGVHELGRLLASARTSVARVPNGRSVNPRSVAAARSALADAFDRADGVLRQMGVVNLDAMSRRVAETGRRQRTTIIVMLMLAIVAICLVLLLAYLAACRLVGRVTQLARQADRLIDGDHDSQVDTGPHDEIGQMARVFNELARRLRRAIDEERLHADRLGQSLAAIRTFAGAVAAGDLSVRANLGDDDGLRPLARDLNAMVAGLSAISEAVKRGSGDISSSAAQIFAVVSEHNMSTSVQAESIAETTATVGEVRTNAQQAAHRARMLADQAREASVVSNEGVEVVAELLTGMDDIQHSVEEILLDIRTLEQQRQAIGQINASVTDLAEESNMLALNATIEAARAGEHGRGFAVVAEQVRRLADQSKQATSHVQALLQEIDIATAKAVRATETGVTVVHSGRIRAGEVRAILDRLGAAVGQTATTADQIAQATREQAVGMDQIDSAMRSVWRETDELSRGARQTRDAAGVLSEVADNLSRQTRWGTSDTV